MEIRDSGNRQSSGDCLPFYLQRLQFYYHQYFQISLSKCRAVAHFSMATHRTEKCASQLSCKAHDETITSCKVDFSHWENEALHYWHLGNLIGLVGLWMSKITYICIVKDKARESQGNRTQKTEWKLKQGYTVKSNYILSSVQCFFESQIIKCVNFFEPTLKHWQYSLKCCLN